MFLLANRMRPPNKIANRCLDVQYENDALTELITFKKDMKNGYDKN